MPKDDHHRNNNDMQYLHKDRCCGSEIRNIMTVSPAHKDLLNLVELQTFLRFRFLSISTNVFSWQKTDPKDKG